MDLLTQIWTNLAANKLRSFLTMFGILWGVVSIVLLSAVGEGFQRGNQQVLEELGKNIVIIRNGRTSMQAGGARAGRVIRLALDDVVRLREKSKLLQHVSPELIRSGISVKSPFNAASLALSGVWPVYQYFRTIEVDRGRPLNEADSEQARRVVVIGFEASKQLFAARDPVGTDVRLNGIPYTVVGRVRKKKQDSNYTGQDDERLFLPYEAMKRDFPLLGDMNTPDSLSTIIAGTHPQVTTDLRERIERGGGQVINELADRGPVENEVRAILGPTHDFDPRDIEALSFWNTTIESVMFEKMITGMRSFFVGVSIITLLLGGIGVMNIMLVAVRERTREIGLRKAVGATSAAVRWQFFSEGLALTILSGGLGLGIGYGLCSLVNLATMPDRFAGMITTWQTGVFSVVVLAVIGIGAATYPASRAAALPPVEALRRE